MTAISSDPGSNSPALVWFTSLFLGLFSLYMKILEEIETEAFVFNPCHACLTVRNRPRTILSTLRSRQYSYFPYKNNQVQDNTLHWFKNSLFTFLKPKPAGSAEPCWNETKSLKSEIPAHLISFFGKISSYRSIATLFFPFHLHETAHHFHSQELKHKGIKIQTEPLWWPATSCFYENSGANLLPDHDSSEAPQTAFT